MRRFLNARDALYFEAWDVDQMTSRLVKSCIQLNVHVHNITTMPFEALQSVWILSGGALLVSQQSDVDDQGAWQDIVDFAESPFALAGAIVRLANM